jgi:hypothetical protein
MRSARTLHTNGVSLGVNVVCYMLPVESPHAGRLFLFLPVAEAHQWYGAGSIQHSVS